MWFSITHLDTTARNPSGEQLLITATTAKPTKLQVTMRLERRRNNPTDLVDFTTAYILFDLRKILHSPSNMINYSSFLHRMCDDDQNDTCWLLVRCVHIQEAHDQSPQITTDTYHIKDIIYQLQEQPASPYTLL